MLTGPVDSMPWIGRCLGSFLRFSAQHLCQLFVAYLISLSLLILALLSTLKGGGLFILSKPQLSGPTKGLVLAKSRTEDISWAYNSTSGWNLFIYTSDGEPGFYSTPSNKGREGMAYLTHIIDNYDSLTDVTVFMHGGASQWHNDVGDTTSSYLLSRLRIESIRRKGYVNLRCENRPGCPVAIRPWDPAFTSIDDIVYSNFTTIYTELFGLPVEQVPQEIGGICCGQVSVTKQRILERPLAEYIHIRDWALSTSLDNFTVGSVFEMLWHLVFMEDPVSCPDATQCYCELYGFCNG